MKRDAGAGLYREAAEQGGADAQNNLGLCYLDGKGVEKDWAKAAYWFRKAAEQNHAAAWRPAGRSLPPFRKAAEQNHAAARNNLGYCCDNGCGVKQDMKEAVRWYRMAAGQGCAVAQCNLGICCHSGDGVEKDFTEAVRWYREAAGNGHADAQKTLRRLRGKRGWHEAFHQGKINDNKIDDQSLIN